MAVTSSAFGAGRPVPKRHTADGADVSPPLAWTNVPQRTAELALICDDPDAPVGVWTHWVIYNIPAATSALTEGVPRDLRLSEPAGALQGRNSWPSGNVGYRGPAPPSGTHHYHFRLFALDARLELRPGLTKAELLAALEGHVLATAELVGTYSR